MLKMKLHTIVAQSTTETLGIDGGSKYLLMLLIDLVESSSLSCCVSYTILSKLTGYNDNTIKKRLKLLLDKGYINVKSGHGMANEYAINSNSIMTMPASNYKMIEYFHKHVSYMYIEQ